MIYDFLLHWFYQPLFNFLIGIYSLANFIYPDISIGTVVIIFTILFRIVILPLSWKNDYSEVERREIAEKIAKLETEHKEDPETIKRFKKTILWQHKRLVFFEFVNLTLQVSIAAFLFKFFSTGVTGQDNYLVYKIIKAPEHINTYFFGIDLNHPNMQLNLLNSSIIFLVELLSLWNQPFPVTRRDLSTLIFLPIIAFIFFGRMPAGKKLFVITTLIFTIFIILVKRLLYFYHKIKAVVNNKTQKETSESPVDNEGEKDDKVMVENIKEEK